MDGSDDASEAGLCTLIETNSPGIGGTRLSLP